MHKQWKLAARRPEKELPGEGKKKGEKCHSKLVETESPARNVSKEKNTKIGRESVPILEPLGKGNLFTATCSL